MALGAWIFLLMMAPPSYLLLRAMFPRPVTKLATIVRLFAAGAIGLPVLYVSYLVMFVLLVIVGAWRAGTKHVRAHLYDIGES